MAFNGMAQRMSKVQYLAQAFFSRVFCHNIPFDFTTPNNMLLIVLQIDIQQVGINNKAVFQHFSQTGKQFPWG